MDKIECVTVDGDIPSYSSGEMLTCYADSGLVCRNADNFPVDCQNYKIRYHCNCRKYYPPPTPTSLHSSRKTCVVTILCVWLKSIL